MANFTSISHSFKVSGILQNKDTKNGTLRFIRIPCRMAIGIASLPEHLLIVESSMSDDPIPAADIGASCPKYFLITGAHIRAVISRKIFASNAMVPSSVASCSPMLGVLSCVISTDDME